MASVPGSAPPFPGRVAEGSCRDEDGRPLSRPGPFTDSDSEPCRAKEPPREKSGTELRWQKKVTRLTGLGWEVGGASRPGRMGIKAGEGMGS